MYIFTRNKKGVISSLVKDLQDYRQQYVQLVLKERETGDTYEKEKQVVTEKLWSLRTELESKLKELEGAV